MSLENKTWIPLDRCIQERIWKQDKQKETMNMLDVDSTFIYEICLCIFQFRFFSKGQQGILAELYEKADKECLRELLDSVFFSYTEELIKYVESKQYDKIINSYFTFKLY